MKKCMKCGETLPLQEGFYPHSKMKDGYLNKCKTCAKLDTVQNRRKRVEYYRQYDDQRRDLPHRILARAAFQKKSRMQNPHKYTARQHATRALAAGKLIKEVCYFCGSDQNIEMHHQDYSKPLQVHWLCLVCHRKLDNMQGVHD